MGFVVIFLIIIGMFFVTAVVLCIVAALVAGTYMLIRDRAKPKPPTLTVVHDEEERA